MRWMRLRRISVCDLYSCHILVTDKIIEHIQSSNDSIIESMFGRNVGTGMVMEAGLSGGLRAKAEELQGLLKQILNL